NPSETRPPYRADLVEALSPAHYAAPRAPRGCRSPPGSRGSVSRPRLWDGDVADHVLRLGVADARVVGERRQRGLDALRARPQVRTPRLHGSHNQFGNLIN